VAEMLGIGETAYPVDPTLIYAIQGFVVGVSVGLASRLRLARRLAAWASMGIISGFAFSVLKGHVEYVTVGLYGLEFTVFYALVCELAVYLIGGRLELVEHLALSWDRVRFGLASKLLVGLLLGSALTATNHAVTSGGDVVRGLLLGLISGLVLGLFFGFTLSLGSGLRVSHVPTRVLPTEGVWRSARYGVVVGVSATVTVGLCFFVGGLSAGLPDASVKALVWGPGAGLIWGLAAGLGATLQYFSIRLLLWRHKLAPLRFRRWLDYMVRLRLMYRGVGGSYVFMHQIVQAYFAGAAPSDSFASGGHT
jgi:hypothetical protein